MRILIVGSIALDNVETPFGRRDRMAGGSAIYFSLAASHFTGVDVVGVVGEDFPPDLLSSLPEKGIDTRGIKVMKGKTFTWTGRYLEDMNRRESICTELNVFADFDPDIPEEYRGDKVIFLANIDPDLQDRVLSSVRNPLLVALDTMNFWIKGKPESLRRVIKKAHILLINEEEIKLLSEEKSLLKGIRKVFRMGPGVIVVKRGEYGALIAREDWLCHFPAILLPHVSDPTGAGDTFAGGFIGHLTRAGGKTDRENLVRGMLYGTALASICVERFGADGLLECSASAIDERVEEVLATSFSR